MIKRRANVADIERLVEIHLRNFDPDEFSMTLGPPFVRHFHQIAVNSPEANVTVGEDDGHIFCFAIGFTGYAAFQAKLKRAILIPLAFHVLALLLTRRFKAVFSIIGYVLEKTAPLPDNVADYHMGLICLDKHTSRSPAHVIFFYKLFEDAVRLVREAGQGRCWTSAFADNKASVRLIRQVINPDVEFVFRTKPKSTLGFICNGPREPRSGSCSG